ncbi:hypothetical protein T439DRAFT_336535 [Meredithblackwellia eburnea MCA 4105]
MSTPAWLTTFITVRAVWLSQTLQKRKESQFSDQNLLLHIPAHFLCLLSFVSPNASKLLKIGVVVTGVSIIQYCHTEAQGREIPEMAEQRVFQSYQVVPCKFLPLLRKIFVCPFSFQSLPSASLEGSTASSMAVSVPEPFLPSHKLEQKYLFT